MKILLYFLQKQKLINYHLKKLLLIILKMNDNKNVQIISYFYSFLIINYP